MRVTLTVIAGPGHGTVMQFDEPRGFIIGRAEDADYRLPEDDRYVSRRHVFLEISPPSCRVRDLGATNRLLVNGRPVQETDLVHGDTLELGYTRFEVTVSGEAAPLPDVCCVQCGRRIAAAPGAGSPDLCEACRRARLAAPAPPALKEIARCRFCGTDLSRRANSDGRAEELRHIVSYSCERCLPFDDRVRGAAIGDFVLVRCLGEGGMGVVHAVHHPPTGRLLALKQVKGLTDAMAIKRFERESRIMQSLVHDHIVRCLHTGTHADGPFIVTEFVPDGNLEGLVQRTGGRLPQGRAVQIVHQVLDGIGYLHDRQIVHRDVKPQNILIRVVQGRSETVKLTDFGLAKCHSRAGGTRLTKHKTGMGTLMFMPPEQIRDAAAVRGAADLYAVGVTLYYLLTGRYTFDFPTPKEVADLQKQKPEEWRSPEDVLGWIMRMNRVKHPFQIILGETPIPIRDREASIPKRLAEAIDKAVQKDPDERYRTAAEFQAALRGAVRT
jgi:eukaryotic-like serine/threonine-protein kinase